MDGPQRQSRFEKSDDVVVMKFGGTSVEDADALRRLIATVQSRLAAQPVVVVSALARVTDQLLEAGNDAVGRRLGAALDIVREIYVRHEQLAGELVVGSAERALERELRSEFQALESLLHDLYDTRVFDLRSQDYLLGFGENLSSRLVTAVLEQGGVQATHVDARRCIVTDGRHGKAAPVWDVTNQRLQETLAPLLDARRVPVLGGFVAATVDGVPTTLGRGGSDFTAVIVGAALSASRVEIWTDVDGIMTADPKLCPEARVIRKMSFEQAAELAHAGAKVLHPATLAPAMRENIPVHVLNSRNPQAEGTEIASRSRTNTGISSITAKRNVAVVEVVSEQEIDSEVLRAVYAAFDRHACPIEVLATSQGRMSLLVGSTVSLSLPGIAADVLGVANLCWENHKALVCVVGENIRRQPEVVSRAFAAVADMDVRVLCQSASDRTISLLVEESRVEESVRRLHDMFFPRREPSRDWGGISTAYCEAG
jgi:aspartate kinase